MWYILHYVDFFLAEAYSNALHNIAIAVNNLMMIQMWFLLPVSASWCWVSPVTGKDYVVEVSTNLGFFKDCIISCPLLYFMLGWAIYTLSPVHTRLVKHQKDISLYLLFQGRLFIETDDSLE